VATNAALRWITVKWIRPSNAPTLFFFEIFHGRSLLKFIVALGNSVLWRLKHVELDEDCDFAHRRGNVPSGAKIHFFI
jgi:hypothetical protein